MKDCTTSSGGNMYERKILGEFADIVHSYNGQVKFKNLPSHIQKLLKELGFEYSSDDIIDYKVVARVAKELYKRKGMFPVHPLETGKASDVKFSEPEKSKSQENASFEEQKNMSEIAKEKKAISGTSLHKANKGQIGEKSKNCNDEKRDLNSDNMEPLQGKQGDMNIIAKKTEEEETSKPKIAKISNLQSQNCNFATNSNSEKKEIAGSKLQGNSTSSPIYIIKRFLKKYDPNSKLLDGLRNQLRKSFKLSRPSHAEIILLYLLDDNTPKTWSEVVQKLVEERYMDLNTAKRIVWEELGKKTSPSGRKPYVAIAGQKEDTGEFLYTIEHLEYLKAIEVVYNWIVKTIKNIETLEASEAEERDKKTKIVDFLENYVDDRSRKVYIERLSDIFAVTGKRSLEVDYTHVLAMIPDIAHELIDNPTDIIRLFEEAVELVVNSYFGKKTKLNVRFYNLNTTLLPKQVDSSHLNKFIQVEGVVTRLSPIKPFVVKAVYVCKDCGHEVRMLQKPYASFEYKPYKCPNCGSRGIYRDNELSQFMNYQSLRLQDAPERLRGGETPRYLDAILLDDICDSVAPGDRVIMTGVLRVVEEKKVNKKPVPKTVLIVNNVIKLTKDIEEMELSNEDIDKIEKEAKLAREGKINLVEKMIASLAPSIHGWKMEKLGLLLALFSGEDQKLPDGTTQRHRIHVAMAGDPSVAKSHLLEFLDQIAPRSNLRSGEGVSGPGLTAAVVKDEGGDWILEAGVLVLADKGYALIDELDKMNPEDRNRFHRAMEQGDIRISKAGINATLNARACVIAAANPKYGKWNRMKTLYEQLDLPPTILSRFDLIFIMLDEPDEEKDEKIFSTIASRWRKDKDYLSPPYDTDFLRKYIVYAKKKIKFVELTKEAEDYLRKFYLRMRKRAMDEETPTLPITPRQAQALIRLAEAHARMHLRDKILKEDAEVAIKLMMYALSKSALDVDTGKIDMALIEFGKPLRELKTEEIIEDLIKRLEILSDYGAPLEDIVTEARVYDISKKEVKKVLKKLMDEGKVYSPRPEYYRVSQE